jgi:5-methylcytosine-specific restriction endonuclease McrA
VKKNMADEPIANDPYSFLPLTEEDHRALGYVYELLRRKAEEWYIKTRREIGDARLALDIVVLKPLCEDCCGRLGRKSLLERVLSGKDETELVILLPEDVVPERVRFYDGAGRSVHLWPPEKPYQEPHRVMCSMCGQRVDSAEGDDIIDVYEVPFLEYFGFLGEDDEGPKRKRGKAERARIQEMYGSRCFDCGVQLDKDNFTLDHIVAQSQGGLTVSINLQPLCHDCNQKKRDLPVTTVKIALDMLLRPLPWDSYEDPIW